MSHLAVVCSIEEINYREGVDIRVKDEAGRSVTIHTADSPNVTDQMRCGLEAKLVVFSKTPTFKRVDAVTDVFIPEIDE